MLTRPECTLNKALKDLDACLEKTYELYHYLMRLPVELTHIQEMRLDEARNKYLPTEEDLHPNTKFVDNRLVAALADNEQLKKFAEDHTVTWNDDPIFERMMLDKVLKSDLYHDYMAEDEGSMDADSQLWQQLMKQVILTDENMSDAIEQRSLFWSEDDMNLTGQFVCKTFRRLADREDDAIMPMYKDEEDSVFGKELFQASVTQMPENNALIDELVTTSRWDKDRIVLMDRIIMCTALAELRTFDKIPTAVTLNEYIELAKNFSTSGSGQFVNGILNNAVKQLRKEGKLLKS
ncbi:MAG: transcription antitermination protein NusB [Muribaculaceae bacterium]|nr:transcription antitermination protein NusB [Muribaculaceae bacterium]MBR5685819.1 transcription antitermination protein NusB [Muribaculaceae bacterium]